MAIGTANRAVVRYVKESTPGTTPATPAMKSFRRTGGGLILNATSVTSNEISSDRMTTDLIRTQNSTSGPLQFELSFGAFDDFIASLLGNSWSTPLALSGTDISASSADNSFNSVTTNLSSIVAGQVIKVAGFTGAGVPMNTLHTVVSATATKVIVTTTLVTVAAGASVSITGSYVRNGTTLDQYTIQEHIQDTASAVYINHRGAGINSMDLNFQTGGILTGSFDILAQSTTPEDAQFSGATFPAVSTTTPMSAASNVLSIHDNGSAMAARVQSMSLKYSNNLRGREAIGVLGFFSLAMQRIDLSGNMSIYFEDRTMLDRYINGTAFSHSFTLRDIAGNMYTVTLPKLKFDTGQLAGGSIDQDFMINAGWKALRDPSMNAVIQICKFPA